MSQYYSIYVGQTSLISTKVQFLIQLQNTCMINHWSKQTKNFKLGTRDCRNGAFSVCKLLEVLTVDIGAADPFPVPRLNEKWLIISTIIISLDNHFLMPRWRGKISYAQLYSTITKLSCFQAVKYLDSFLLFYEGRVPEFTIFHGKSVRQNEMPTCPCRPLFDRKIF